MCENNGYAISVPLDRQVAGGSVAARAAGYGMPGVTVDGGDVLACYARRKGGPRPRPRGEGPTLIEAHVVRLTTHSRTTTSAATAIPPRSRRSRSVTRSRCSRNELRARGRAHR